MATALIITKTATPLRAQATARWAQRRSCLAPVASLGAQGLCGLTQEDANARMAKAPASVQAFIARWGHRQGIESAYVSECQVDWAIGDVALLESTDEVPGHHHETAMESAVHDMLENLTVVSGWDNPGQRLAAAPASVSAFIQRWGRREGIDAAAA